MKLYAEVIGFNFGRINRHDIGQLVAINLLLRNYPAQQS